MEQIQTGESNVPFPNKPNTTSAGSTTELLSEEYTTTNTPWPESDNKSIKSPLSEHQSSCMQEQEFLSFKCLSNATECEQQLSSIQGQEFASLACLPNGKLPDKNDVIVVGGDCTNDYSDIQISADMCNATARESDSTKPNISCTNDYSEKGSQNTSLDIIDHNTAVLTCPARTRNEDHRSQLNQDTATMKLPSENNEELEQSLKDLLKQGIGMQKANRDMMFNAKFESKGHGTLLLRLTDIQETLCRLETQLHQDDVYLTSLDERVCSIMSKINIICDLLKLPATQELSGTQSTEDVTNNPNYLTNLKGKKSSMRVKDREDNQEHMNHHESHSVLKSSVVAPECFAYRTENIDRASNIPLDISREQKMTSKSALNNTEKVIRTSHSKYTTNGVSEEESRSSKSSLRKCNELGFKCRKTRQQVDNRLKVMRKEVVLQSNAVPPILNNNIKIEKSHDEERKNPSYHDKATGASYRQSSKPSLDFPNRKFFTPYLETLGRSGMRIDEVAATEHGIAVSDIWTDRANQERRNRTFQRAKRVTGPNTVLLLDTSGSMRGQPFTDMIRIAREIIEGIWDVYKTKNLAENIGIAILGQDTTVSKHLTVDYMDVLSSLDDLQPRGPSPFHAGFSMGLAAILGNARGEVATLEGKRLYTRMIFISDGRPTTDHATTDDEVSNPLMISKTKALFKATLHDFARRGYRVFCVPVGNYETVHFKDICTTTKGRIFRPTEIRRLAKMVLPEVLAIQHLDKLRGFTRQQIIRHLDTCELMTIVDTPDVEEDVADYLEFLQERDTVEDPKFHVSLHEEFDPNMPPVGARVRRGPTWKFGNQDTEGPGTVVGHKKDGMIWVEWDNGMKYCYQFMPGIHYIKEVDEPRLVGNGVIATGCLVKRGMDWIFNNHDGGGGNIGIVFSVRENGIIGVRWPSKKKYLYKYGSEGNFEVEICDLTTASQTVGASTGASSAFGRGPTNNVLETLPSKPIRKIESYLPLVDETNRKEKSSVLLKFYNSDTTLQDACHPSNDAAASEQGIAASNMWTDRANQELRHGAFQRAERGTGPDTVLLLDTSGSMRGQPFTDMVRIAREIIEGIRDVYNTKNLAENIGIAILGQDTTVLKHLTVDYMDLLSSLDTLHPGGPSSFHAGFLMGLAAMLGNARGEVSFEGEPLYNRLIFITDGRATTDQATTDDEDNNPLMITKIQALFRATLCDFARRGYRVFCVPVGNYKMAHLNDICTITNGRVFRSNEIRRLVMMVQAEIIAIRHLDSLGGYPRQRIIQHRDTCITMISLETPNIEEDIADYIEFLLERDQLEDGSIDISSHEEFDPNMPPIGARVRRGPTWKFGNEDTEGPGTVVGHQRDGMIRVEWDSGMKNRYSYMPGIHDVKEVDEPRLVGDKLIATGCLVKRGMDWTYNDQDGGHGNIGIVFSVTENGIVGVRWPTKKKCLYKYGSEGKFEVAICDPATTCQKVYVTTGGSTAFEGGPMNHIPSSLPSPPTKTIESYLSSVDEMNRRNVSSVSLKSFIYDTTMQDSFHPCNEAMTPQSKVDIPPSSQPKWQYSGNDGQFKNYPSDINDKIEKAYSKKQMGTTMIQHGGVGYRLLFTKMVQIDIETKVSVPIRRIAAS